VKRVVRTGRGERGRKALMAHTNGQRCDDINRGHFCVKSSPRVTCDTGNLQVNFGLSRDFRSRVTDRYVLDRRTEGQHTDDDGNT